MLVVASTTSSFLRPYKVYQLQGKALFWFIVKPLLSFLEDQTDSNLEMSAEGNDFPMTAAAGSDSPSLPQQEQQVEAEAATTHALPSQEPPPPPAPTAAPRPKPRPFPVQHITYFERPVAILLQEENGPCPLLALCNILSLQGKINVSLYVQQGYVTQEALTNALASYILERLDDHSTQIGGSANVRHNSNDALEVLPKFVEGMDINVKFRKVDDYEASREVAVIDAAGVSLVHGWIIDDQEKDLLEETSPNMSYNVMIEKMLSEKGAPHFKQWIEDHRTQLTVAGLFALNADITEGGLKMFFRNNHYSVITKRKGVLFTLVTDAAMSRPAVVWESLQDVDGHASQFVDANFGERPRRVTPPVQPAAAIPVGHVRQPPAGRDRDTMHYDPVGTAAAARRRSTDNARYTDYDRRRMAEERRRKKEEDCCSIS